MNCTLCQSLMFSNSEIHSALVNERTVSRIDLHCNNNHCPAFKLLYIFLMFKLLQMILIRGLTLVITYHFFIKANILQWLAK